MGNKCLGVVVLLVLVIGGGVYKFIFQGSVSSSTDGRLAIVLEAAEKDLVLAEMRAFLESIQMITQGLSQDDMTLVVSAAKNVGKEAQGAVPGTLVGKLPLEFKKMGFDTHTRFDQLALNAKEFGDTQTVLTELTIILQNCTSCHATYRLDVVDKKRRN